MVKLTRDSKFIEYVKLLNDKMACVEAIDHYENNLSINPDITVGEELDKFLADESIGQSWATWTLKVLGNDLAEDIRLGFIEKIKDPMMAFDVYLSLADLTSEEDQLLEAKFKDKLPRAEKELKDGIVTRTKNA